MDGYVTIGTKLDTKDFEKQIIQLEDKLDTLEQERGVIASQKTISGSDLELLKKYDAEIEKTKNQIIGLRQKQEDLAKQNTFQGIDIQLGSILKKVAKWGLAIFGIRSAYMAVRQATSVLSEHDENMASQLEYIRWTLANAIAPIVKFIINAVYVILQYINQITRALFGWDLFKGPKEFSKSMKSASGSAKQIKKSLAGFDEMNILGDNTTASGGGGGGGTPTFDTESVEKAMNKVKSKIKEIENAWREETKNMEKWLENPKAFKKAYGNADWLMMGITRMGVGINNTVFGIFDTISGVSKTIVGLVTGNDKLIEQGIAQTGKGIQELVYGVLSFIYGLFETKVGLIKLGLSGLLNWLQTTFLKKMREYFGPIGSIIAYPVISAVANIKTTFESWASGVKKIFNGVLKFIKGDFKGGINNVFGGLKDILLAPFRGMRDAINKIIKGLNKIKLPSALGGVGINIPTIPKFAKGTILNNPGRGVPIGIGGEVGREALLPLSDARLLEDLGSTIGKYITINLTNETKLDGRTIARKITQLNTSENFLRNR